MKDVGAVGEKESESEENEEEICHRTVQEIPLVTSAHWELSDSSKDSGREDPLLRGMRSSDSELP